MAASSIEQAIELNGVAVDRNKQAFRQGRSAVHADATRPDAEMGRSGGPTVPGKVDAAGVARVRAIVQADGDLTEIIDRGITELIAYQDDRYAERYARFVEHVRVAENDRVAGSATLTAAVARNLFKLMAYKDEYEVARLCLDPALEEEVHAKFGPGSRASFRLHPPVLRALGMRRKIALGPWARPALRALYGARGLRGTGLDPFGRAKVRRVERQLIEEYREAIANALAVLRAGNIDRVSALAELPDEIRGYEEVKLRNVARFRDELATALAEIGAAPGTSLQAQSTS